MSLRGEARRSAYPKGNALRRALTTLRVEGVGSVWFKVLGQLGYRRLMLLERTLDQAVADFSPNLPVEVTQLAERELDDYVAFRPETRRRDAIDRLRSGQMCFVACRDGRIVAAGWIAVQPTWLPYVGCAIDMAPGDVHSYDKFALPAFRGYGISNALRMHQLRHLRRAGYRRVIATVVPENASSLRDILKGGYRPCGMIGRIKIGPWQRHFRTRPRA
jgi:GNAT superfamily N-acetyltransferase